MAFSATEKAMRATALTIIVAAGLGTASAAAQSADSKPFWQRVQKICDSTAAATPNEIATRIAQTAIDEHYRFGGHQIDANGRLFRFGLVEAEQEESDGDDDEARLGHLGWWQVLKYWRALHGSNARVAARLRVWGYEEASASRNDDKPEAAGGDRAPLHGEAAVADAIKIPAADLIKLGKHADDQDTAEVLREAAFRAAIIDNPWSAAFISYVVKIAALGDTPNLPHVQDFAKTRFQFSSAHRHYIFAAFKTSIADAGFGQKAPADAHFYRACPISTTKPRIGDLVCYHREKRLADANESAVRDRILSEAHAGQRETSVSRNHCDVVVHIDSKAQKMYVAGGNVQQSVTVKKLRLRRDLKFAENRNGCGDWTLPPPSGGTPVGPGMMQNCSLNEKKWFVLLQMR
jgi:hypothetical protein